MSYGFIFSRRQKQFKLCIFLLSVTINHFTEKRICIVARFLPEQSKPTYQAHPKDSEWGGNIHLILTPHRFEGVGCSQHPDGQILTPKYQPKWQAILLKISKGMSGKADLNKLKSGVFSRNWLEISASTLLQCKEFISCLWRALLLHDFLQMTHRIKKKYKKEEKKKCSTPTYRSFKQA